MQGSVLGVMDHNAVLENINEDITEQEMFKYVDDITLEENIHRDIPVMLDRDSHYFRPPLTQESFNKLMDKCNEKGLKINEKKTQLLTISATKHQNKSWLKLKDGSILHSSEELKLLGFTFTEEPTVHKHLENLIQKAASRSFVIRHLASVDIDKTRLKNIYCSIVRSVMEYSSITYGSMIPQYIKNTLENVQKKCLRSIYGAKLSYKELLETSGLETLDQRRENALLKFAKKAAQNPQFANWFPKNTNRSSNRIGKEFEEVHARTDRLYFSPIYVMRRRLNASPDEDRLARADFSDLSSIFNSPF